MLKKIPSYIFFDVFNFLASTVIAHLYSNEIEIWYVSYFFVFLLFCLSIFLKQYDGEYLHGIRRSTDSNTIEWALMFAAMLFPGWLAGGALLGLLGYSADEISSYNVSVIPVMVVYPLLFGLFPFRKALRIKQEEPGPISNRRTIYFHIIPDTMIYVFSVYLLIFYNGALTRAFEPDRIASMDSTGRAALWVVSMLGLLVIYLPARMHFFFNSPNDFKNKISLLVTVVLISIYAIVGVRVF